MNLATPKQTFEDSSLVAVSFRPFVSNNQRPSNWMADWMRKVGPITTAANLFNFSFHSSMLWSLLMNEFMKFLLKYSKIENTLVTCVIIKAVRGDSLPNFHRPISWSTKWIGENFKIFNLCFWMRGGTHFHIINRLILVKFCWSRIQIFSNNCSCTLCRRLIQISQISSQGRAGKTKHCTALVRRSSGVSGVKSLRLKE